MTALCTQAGLVVHASPEIRASDATLFRIGSTSKAFVALTAQALVREGRLSLNQPLAEALPGFYFANAWVSTDPVRIVHLLEHTSGFDDNSLRSYANSEPVPLALAAGLAQDSGCAYTESCTSSANEARTRITARPVGAVDGRNRVDRVTSSPDGVARTRCAPAFRESRPSCRRCPATRSWRKFRTGRRAPSLHAHGQSPSAIPAETGSAGGRMFDIQLRGPRSALRPIARRSQQRDPSR